jgi:phage tail sheath protein FI
MAQGNLFCDIGVALTRPAEFVDFRVTQYYS